MKLYLTLLLVVSAWCGANNSMFACGSSTTPNDVDEGSMFDALGAPEETEDVGAIGEVKPGLRGGTPVGDHENDRRSLQQGYPYCSWSGQCPVNGGDPNSWWCNQNLDQCRACGGTYCTGSSGGTIGNPQGRPSSIVGGYYAVYAGATNLVRLTDLQGYNMIYLAFAVMRQDRPTSDPVITFSDAEATINRSYPGGFNQFIADLRTVRGRGVRIMISVGGAGESFLLRNWSTYQSFVTTMTNMIRDKLQLQVDGLDWNNFENIGRSLYPYEQQYMADAGLALKRTFGSRFLISAAPAPWNQDDANLLSYMRGRGALDFAAPQWYDLSGLNGADISATTVMNQMSRWTRALGGGRNVIVGVGFKTGGACSSAANSCWSDNTTTSRNVLTAIKNQTSGGIGGAMVWTINSSRTKFLDVTRYIV